MINATCAVTLCLTPALQITTSTIVEQINPDQALEVIQTNLPHKLNQPVSIAISTVGPYNLNDREQQVMHKALMRSVQIIDDGNFVE